MTGVTAPAVFDGPIDTDSFQAYVDHVLVSTLCPGDWVIADHLAVHQPPAVRAAIERAGTTLHLRPAYSPDFNPIEQAFATLTAFLRAARPRTFDAVYRLIAAALPLFAPEECLASLRHSGYTGATP